MGESLTGLYRKMLLIRRVEERLLEALGQGLVAGSMHLCIGQEAIPVGTCDSLNPDDPIISTYRGHGWALARGVPPSALVAEVMGRDSELNGGRAGSAYFSAADYHFYGENSIVGAGVPIALGLGLACKREGGNRVPVVSIGDGAMNQGNVHESLNMASVLKIPLLVIVENNGYAEMTPSALLTAVAAAKRAAGYGIEGVEVDGNDPTAVAQTIAKARARSLATSMPILVEAHTHRLAGHYSGDAQAYRPQGELDSMRHGDPLVLAAEHMSSDSVALLRVEVEAAVQIAFDTAAATPSPDPKGAREHVFSQ